VPSFLQQLETTERWRRFPALERLEGAGVALTFDDGPDRDATPAVLEALRAAAAPATFFLVGEQVEAHPELAAEVAAGGHVVGLHGYRHVEHDELADPRADLERGAAVLAAATGRSPALFRPPYGRFSAASYAACRELGLSPVYWSGWGCDWEPIPAARIADLVIRDIAPGAIVLLHDSARYAYRDSALPTAEALPAVVEATATAGLELVSLGSAGVTGAG
jgi:peptidoglycan/xylan/chitin deacetylase (PgdA/CDA1 family)